MDCDRVKSLLSDYLDGVAPPVPLLEIEIEDLNRSLAGMRDELQFVQRLLEDPARAAVRRYSGPR